MIFFGTGMYGEVDEVPGLCSVQTQFFHVYWMPLVPVGTYAVILDEEDDDGDFRGSKIGISGRSIMMGYIRGLFGVTLGVSVLLGVISLFGVDMSDIPNPWIVASAAFVLLMLSYMLCPWSTAGYDRAIELGEALGLTEEGFLLIEEAYGKAFPEDVAARLEELQAEREAVAAAVDEERAAAAEERREVEIPDDPEARKALRKAQFGDMFGKNG